MRPSWHDTFMDLARVWAKRSTCDRLHTAAVMVNRDNQVLSTGYNGAPRGLPHCDEVGHLLDGDHCVRAVHAEQNAIAQAARVGVSLLGCTAYILHVPCVRCAIMMIQAGIAVVVYEKNYKSNESIELLNRAGVKVYSLDAINSLPGKRVQIRGTPTCSSCYSTNMKLSLSHTDDGYSTGWLCRDCGRTLAIDW